MNCEQEVKKSYVDMKMMKDQNIQILLLSIKAEEPKLPNQDKDLIV